MGKLLKCCNRAVQIIKEIDLLDTRTQTHRFLVIGRCKNPNCGALKAQIIYYDIKQGKFIRELIKSKDVQKTIKTLEDNPFLQLNDLADKQGNYSNQNWIYGKTKIVNEDNQLWIEDWAINFNGEKRLVRKKQWNKSTT